jgi:ribosomal protein L11 methyltransferase
MSWLQVELRVPAAAVPAVDAELQDLGALSVSFSDPGGEPVLEPAPGATPLWSEAIIAAILPDSVPETEVHARLRGVLGYALPSVRFSRVANRDWVREFRENLAPMRFGERLWVCPAGVACPDAGATAITLEPGLAFGSGSHPTTAMCLHWLAGSKPNGLAVLDWGCGSGILAVAAIALGAETVTALDIDDQALDATRENARRNRCNEFLRVAHPDRLPADARYDIVVANILAGSLIDLAPRLARHCRSGARVALSGILATQAEQVRAACAPWLELRLTMAQEDWVLLTGTPGVHQTPDLPAAGPGATTMSRGC